MCTGDLTVGLLVVGLGVGTRVDGDTVGSAVVGLCEMGLFVGSDEGSTVGSVGFTVGSALGLTVGSSIGSMVGVDVVWSLTPPHSSIH